MKLAFGWLVLLLCGGVECKESKCERLKATLEYTQEEAPRDLSSVLPVVVEKVNRVLEGVVDVEVEWTGADLHGRVGEHIVECTVTRLVSAISESARGQYPVIQEEDTGREVTKQCFHVPFTILDTNECTLPPKHQMRHVCPDSSVCVNTIGSYECVCPALNQGISSLTGIRVDDKFWTDLSASESSRTPWELSFGKSLCPSKASTHDCCLASAFTSEGLRCRQRFQCPTDPCQSSDCASSAECTRLVPGVKPDYKCTCPTGTMGNGHACTSDDPKPQPKVQHDGVTPTEQTIKNNFFCSCTTPIVDACDGFDKCTGKHEICIVGRGNKPKCGCKPGFVHHEEYGCVDQNPPTLKLRHDPHGDQTLRLKQGDAYQEPFVDIIDENAEDYLRSLKISYSQPLPSGCLTQVGEFHVNYTVAMPWATTPYVRITRHVIIDDIDECQVESSKFASECPSLVPQCDKKVGAKCRNTVGSYACQCPSGSTGDGFMKSASFGDFSPPDSYQRGTSCTDTSKPVITLQGPNPKEFKICECGGLSGIMRKSKNRGQDNNLHAEQRKLYEQDIKDMIRDTAGAELCASYGNPEPGPKSCASAIDKTFQGEVDLSDRVVIGEPIMKSTLHWQVPYDVKDDAGNEAITVFRDVIVSEVDLTTVANKIREEVRKEQEVATKTAVQKAIRAEKLKWETEHKAKSLPNQRRSSGGKNCPACLPCKCPDTPQFDRESCSRYCENLSQSCALNDDNYTYSLLFWLETYLAPSFVPIFLWVLGTCAVLFMVRYVLTSLFNPRAHEMYGYDNGYDQYQGSGRNDSFRHPTQHRPPMAPAAGTPYNMPTTPGNGHTNSFFSPTAQQQGFSPAPSSGHHFARSQPATPMSMSDADMHYSSPPLITPSRGGEGVRRRNPYS